jgi:hypothetical protein
MLRVTSYELQVTSYINQQNNFMENQQEYNPYEQQFEENTRPGFLTFLCVLTFIGSGLSLLTNLFLPIIAQPVLEMMSNSTLPEEVIRTYEQAAVTPVWQFYLLALFCATSLMGAIYMIKMKKIGFHIYVISQIAQMAIGQFILGGTFQPKWIGIFITALFIGLYARYYKKFETIEEN